MCYRTGKHCCIKTLSTEHRCVIGPENTVASKRLALNIDVLKDRKIHCLQARPCVIQPGTFTGCGNEGVMAKGKENLITLAAWLYRPGPILAQM